MVLNVINCLSHFNIQKNPYFQNIFSLFYIELTLINKQIKFKKNMASGFIIPKRVDY